MFKAIATLLLFLCVLACGSDDINDPCEFETGDVIPMILYEGGYLGESIQMETNDCGTIVLLFSGPRGYHYHRYSAGDTIKVKVKSKKNRITYYVEVL